MKRLPDVGNLIHLGPRALARIRGKGQQAPPAFRPLTRVAAIATWTLYGLWWTSCLMTILLLYDIWTFLQLPSSQPASASLLLNRHTAVSVVHQFAFIAAVATFMPWSWRAARNLPALHGLTPEQTTNKDTKPLSPWHATIGWLPPLLNIYYAYLTLRALCAAPGVEHPRLPDAARVFIVSWAVASTLHFGALLALPTGSGLYPRNQLLEATLFSLTANLIALIAVAAMLRLIAAISTAQHQQSPDQTPNGENQT